MYVILVLALVFNICSYFKYVKRPGTVCVFLFQMLTISPLIGQSIGLNSHAQDGGCRRTRAKAPQPLLKVGTAVGLVCYVGVD